MLKHSGILPRVVSDEPSCCDPQKSFVRDNIMASERYGNHIEHQTTEVAERELYRVLRPEVTEALEEGINNNCEE